MSLSFIHSFVRVVERQHMCCQISCGVWMRQMRSKEILEGRHFRSMWVMRLMMSITVCEVWKKTPTKTNNVLRYTRSSKWSILPFIWETGFNTLFQVCKFYLCEASGRRKHMRKANKDKKRKLCKHSFTQTLPKDKEQRQDMVTQFSSPSYQNLETESMSKYCRTEPILCKPYPECVQGDHSACAKPPVYFNTKVPLWPGLAWPGQARSKRNFYFWSQREVLHKLNGHPVVEPDARRSNACGWNFEVMLAFHLPSPTYPEWERREEKWVEREQIDTEEGGSRLDQFSFIPEVKNLTVWGIRLFRGFCNTFSENPLADHCIV